MTNTEDKILKALDTLTHTLREEMQQGFIQTDKKIESAKEEILAQCKEEHNQILDAVYDDFEAEGKYAKGLEKRIEELELLIL